MRKYYISKNYADKFTASSKAKIDCEVIAERCGYKNIGLPRKIISSKFFGRLYTVLSNIVAILRMPKDSVVFLQFPVSCYKYLINYAIKRRNNVITIIHDIDVIRGFGNSSELDYVSKSDVVIVHTESMKKWCTENLKFNSIVVLEIFDYLYDFEFKPTKLIHADNHIRVAFAGNLAKSEFIDRLSFSEKIEYLLFGVGFDLRNVRYKNINYMGSFPADTLWQELKADFGLVWDGNDISGCNGPYGEYLKYISPHKLSLYLSCGLPVIVWSDSAMKDFVIKNKVGLTMSSISELEDVVDNPVFDQLYEEYLKNARMIRDNIISGYYLRKALESAEEQL